MFLFRLEVGLYTIKSDHHQDGRRMGKRGLTAVFFVPLAGAEALFGEKGLHGHVMGVVGENFHDLKGVPDPDGKGRGFQFGQNPVVIAKSESEAMSPGVEGQPGHQHQIQ